MGLFTQNSTLLSLSQSVVSFINLLVIVLIPLALVIFFIGVVRFIANAADARAHTEGRQAMLWSLAALFVLTSVWGILQLLSAAFFPGGPVTTTCSTPGCGPGAYYPGPGNSTAY